MRCTVHQKNGIPALYLFGSYARGEATDDSDMDFLVDTTGTELTSLLRLGALYCDLEDTFGKAIDLITVSSIMQSSTEESDSDFTATVLKERVNIIYQYDMEGQYSLLLGQFFKRVYLYT